MPRVRKSSKAVLSLLSGLDFWALGFESPDIHFPCSPFEQEGKLLSMTKRPCVGVPNCTSLQRLCRCFGTPEIDL